MDVTRRTDQRAARAAAAIGEPARASMLYCLVDGRARTSTELALVAGVSPSTASVHLHKLEAEHLAKVQVQGKHRYYSLDGPEVADVLEALSVLAGGARGEFVPNTPDHLRAARSCYDHMAGVLGVAIHDRLTELGWITHQHGAAADAYDVTPTGAAALASLGVDVDAARRLRRRFAFACLDWSERRAHVGGAIGAALLGLALAKKWVARDRQSRALVITALGHRHLERDLGVRL
ncbi:MAG TPA: helix-turn-helix transcriptional regulator [Gemmatimonadaceae bacterium]|nr:helix-turn-helix transcriptional regulator [Gemmatimonadaceae bacterium]